MDIRNLSLKDWADEDKPREKLLANGKKSLTNAELVAILLRSGCQGMSAVDLAKRVLDMAGNSLSELSRLDVADLLKFKGLGEAKAIAIIAALELGYRMQREPDNSKVFYANSSVDLFDYIAPSIVDLPHEEFWVIYLSNSLKINDKQRIAMGGITSVSVDLRLIFRGTLERNSVRIALAHNHPAGKLIPSNDDIALTNNVISAGKILNINVIDHLIVGIDSNHKPAYYSFRDNELL